ncbi:MAG: OsmC family protein [Sphaerochaeta sp.]|uniref:OsmC family protein n=1 Tax=Sphaerochaeta sp. TaxID=1972642 RepID=UPI001D506B8D|nr:OsmC family protein [uncultured Sphaerochaeta sp.]MDD3929770.1 OsmC family protein [Sphaerochaeta sp.]NCC14137.1 OsmC family peroxiredoxin [Spirochaetia bacterium]NCC90916.1 OsmC family peroxiredoxin [Spirochaetia bacterium]
MGEKKHIRADFVSGHYQFSTDKGSSFEFGPESAPYDYLLGALSGCLFKTFEEVAVKMRISWEHVSFEVNGTKRDAVPTTLEEVVITVQASGTDNQQKFLKAFETATRYCSIYQTISQVSRMSWSVDFL